MNDEQKKTNQTIPTPLWFSVFFFVSSVVNKKSQMIERKGKTKEERIIKNNIAIGSDNIIFYSDKTLGIYPEVSNKKHSKLVVMNCSITFAEDWGKKVHLLEVSLCTYLQIPHLLQYLHEEPLYLQSLSPKR